MELKDKLNNYRKERCWSQQKMADTIGIGITTYKNYELGNRIPQTSTIQLMSETLNLSYEYLVDPNCTNETTENIDINKKLGLSDKAIENISSIKDSELQYSLNYFLENIDIERFFTTLLSFMSAKRIVKLYIKFDKVKKLFPLLDYYKEIGETKKIEEILTYFKSLEEEFQLPPICFVSEEMKKEGYYNSDSEDILHNLDYLNRKYITNEELFETSETEEGETFKFPITYKSISRYDYTNNIKNIGYYRYLCSREFETLLDNIEGYDSLIDFDKNSSTKDIEKYLKEQDKLIKEKKIKSKNK